MLMSLKLHPCLTVPKVTFMRGVTSGMQGGSIHGFSAALWVPCRRHVRNWSGGRGSEHHCEATEIDRASLRARSGNSWRG